VAVREVRERSGTELEVGSELMVEARVELGPLHPVDVAVELYHGLLDPQRDLGRGEAVTMRCEGPDGDCAWRYLGVLRCQGSGQHGYAVRVMPYNEALTHRVVPDLVRWG
jgi:starch phosphorylase